MGDVGRALIVGGGIGGLTGGSAGDYDLVVGADGIGSAVRALVFGPAEPAFAGHISWRSVAPMRLPGPPSIQFWLGDGCFFGLCPVGDDRTYGFGHVTQERRYDPVQGRLGRLRERFAGFGPAVQDYLAALDDDAQVHCSAIEWVDQERWPSRPSSRRWRPTPAAAHRVSGGCNGKAARSRTASTSRRPPATRYCADRASRCSGHGTHRWSSSPSTAAAVR
jgi:hypothetical protein